MKDGVTLCNITAGRLKMLRKGKGLSHEKLSKALLEQYGVTISKSSLINYEATDFNSKSGSNAGMKIEYLRCFADFYGVSADYILGLGDKMTPDVNAQAACEYTGLSEYALEKIEQLPQVLKTALNFALYSFDSQSLQKDCFLYRTGKHPISRSAAQLRRKCSPGRGRYKIRLGTARPLLQRLYNGHIHHRL